MMFEGKNHIGILGGGQLGKMIIESAKNLGFYSSIYCPKGDNPAEIVADNVYHGNWDDYDKIDIFTLKNNFITSEFENIPANVLRKISKKKLVFPEANVFEIAQSRDKEKIFAKKAGFNVPKWFKVNSLEDLRKFSNYLKFNAILKTNSLGYDGKGQELINSKCNLDLVWKKINFNDCILEEKLDFKRELSILYARSMNNSECFFPISENYHENGILRKTKAPANVDNKKIVKIRELTKKLADMLNLIGLLTIELFELKDGNIIFNEIAPRPHNSFHWTIEGCKNSQFDILIKSITGLPIYDQISSRNWEMRNILGNEIKNYVSIREIKNEHLYVYGKKNISPRRKMGHITRELL